MLIYNKLIELPHLKYFRRYRGGRIPPQLRRNTSIEAYGIIDTLDRERQYFNAKKIFRYILGGVCLKEM